MKQIQYIHDASNPLYETDETGAVTTSYMHSFPAGVDKILPPDFEFDQRFNPPDKKGKEKDKKKEDEKDKKPK